MSDRDAPPAPFDNVVCRPEAGCAAYGWWRPIEVGVARPQSDVSVQVFGLGTVEARIISKVGFKVADLLTEPCWRDSIAASRRRGIARGSKREYMAGNLLGLEVTAAGVAQAFDLLALAGKTSAAVVTVDGGNTAAVVR